MNKKQNKKQNKKAFTIVELVIVIAVIAILAAVLVPTFSNIINKARDSAAKQEAKNAYTDHMIKNADKGDMPGEFLYIADGGRFVAIQNGSIIGVYATQEEALKAMGLQLDVELIDTGDGRLWICSTQPGESGDQDTDGAGDVLTGYVALTLELFYDKYWEVSHTTPLDGHVNTSQQYYATVRFTRETLPVGSIIVLEEGWQYRAICWSSETPGNKKAMTNQRFLEITEAWWGVYDYFAFNIAKNGYTTLTLEDEAAVRAAFRIYVPVESQN